MRQSLECLESPVCSDDRAVVTDVDQTLSRKILASFNTWAFKREQPSDLPLLLNVIAGHVCDQTPVPFVLYWGKGPRATLAPPDLACLDYLSSLVGRIGAVRPGGATLHLVLTDTHARLNGHAESAIDSYFGSIAEAARARSFRTHRLSRVVERSWPATVTATPPDRSTLAMLERCAAKWYRGDGSTLEGATQYYEMNMVERRAMEQAFPRTVFVTFNGSDCRALFPDNLPIFYMYSLRKGFSVKPWFLDEAGQQARLRPPTPA